MASKQPRHHNKIAKANHKGPGVAPALPAGIKGYKKIYLTELPVIDISSGHNITNIRNALIQYCQRELGPIPSIFTDFKYKVPAAATFDAEAVTADTSGVLKEQASAKLKRHREREVPAVEAKIAWIAVWHDNPGSRRQDC